LGAWSFVLGAKPTKVLRGDGTEDTPGLLGGCTRQVCSCA